MYKRQALHLIHGNQHGFRPDRSTETAASVLLDHVESFVFSKAHCLTVFLDIRAAFDSVGPDHIKLCLEDHGADKHITKWYHNYLLHRNITFQYGQTTAERTNSVGFPQGGVCSAKFWSLAFDPAVRIINQDQDKGAIGVAFADDCAISCGLRASQGKPY